MLLDQYEHYKNTLVTQLYAGSTVAWPEDEVYGYFC